MKNIKVFLIIILMNVVLVSVIAQGVDPALVNPLTAQPSLAEISVDKFEDSALWDAHISLDDGVATSRGFDGGPGEVNGKQLIDQEADEKVLGVRVDYFRRGNTIISVDRVRPLEIEGISKTISVWVAGRNYNHNLFVHVEGYTGKQYKLPMGRLNFSGWKQLTVAIPPTIDQVNPFYVPPHGTRTETPSPPSTPGMLTGREYHSLVSALSQLFLKPMVPTMSILMICVSGLTSFRDRPQIRMIFLMVGKSFIKLL